MKLLLLMLAIIAPKVSYSQDIIRIKRGPSSLKALNTSNQCQIKCGSGLMGYMEENACICRKGLPQNRPHFIYLSSPKKSSP